MTISDPGALGEFFGAFAVFATPFRALQVRFARRASDDTSVIMREILLALGRGDLEVARFADVDVHFYREFRDETDALVQTLRSAPGAPKGPPPGMPGAATLS